MPNLYSVVSTFKKRTMNTFDRILAILNTIFLYLAIWLIPLTPGTVIWKLYKTKKGIVKLINRDLICDSQTLMNLAKSTKPLDQFTNSFSPFVPLFILEYNKQCRQRRDVFSYAYNQILTNLEQLHTIDMKLESMQGDILWKIYEIMFRTGFELIFHRTPTNDEFNDMFPGVVDINKIIKRYTSFPDMPVRQKLYNRLLKLINENNPNFILHNHQGFQELDELSQVSLIGEDLLITICIQCTDLLCHMLVLYSEHSHEFQVNLDNCINETLRLYPLTDLWVRQASNKKQRGWIASLVQLNRNGWTNPDVFFADRWNSDEHPPLLSWGFDMRRCPAKKFGTDIVKLVFETITKRDGFWIEPASNFDHERTFPFGCQVWIGYGQRSNDTLTWQFNNKLQMQIRRWIFEKIRIIDQFELN